MASHLLSNIGIGANSLKQGGDELLQGLGLTDAEIWHEKSAPDLGG
jgi:hypothetical protein